MLVIESIHCQYLQVSPGWIRCSSSPHVTFSVWMPSSFLSFLFLVRDWVPCGSSAQQWWSATQTANRAELLQTFCTKKLLSNIIWVPCLSGTQLSLLWGDGLYWLRASSHTIFARGQDTPESMLQQRDMQSGSRQVHYRQLKARRSHSPKSTCCAGRRTGCLPSEVQYHHSDLQVNIWELACCQSLWANWPGAASAPLGIWPL